MSFLMAHDLSHRTASDPEGQQFKELVVSVLAPLS